ncbi:unnamed protein product [Wickerhamomyces anomalus]
MSEEPSKQEEQIQEEQHQPTESGDVAVPDANEESKQDETENKDEENSQDQSKSELSKQESSSSSSAISEMKEEDADQPPISEDPKRENLRVHLQNKDDESNTDEAPAPTVDETAQEKSEEEKPESKEDEEKDEEPKPDSKADQDGDISIPDANNSEYEGESDQGEEDEEPSDAEEDDAEEEDGVRKSKSRSRTAEPPKIKDENDAQNDDAKDQTDVKESSDATAVGGSKNEPYIPQTHTIVIPSYASWFDFKSIHPIEKESLPEFFTNQNPSKTPQIYVKYRNFLINAYRLNPNDYLTVTAARRNLVGDVGTILRLHRFLSRWGLINYQVDAVEKPKPVEPPFTGDYNVTYDAPRGLGKRELNGDGNGVEAKKEEQTGEGEIKDEPIVNGGDVKRPKITKSINDGWTKEDLKKLLEGLTKFKGDWESIATHVGTHTVEQCIIRFLKLPIEDKFVGDSAQNLGPLKYAPYLPFSQADNPVLSTLAFLVSLVDPDVVKAATSNAIKIIDEKDLEQTLEKEEKGESSEVAGNGVEESARISFTTVGARSHIFKTNEEIEMNKLTNVIVNTQLSKLELKMAKLESVEKELDLEKRILQKQQEELFLDRLSFSKTSSLVISKLNNAVEKASSDPQELSRLVLEAKELLAKPARSELASFDLSKRDTKSVQPDQTTDEAENAATTVADDDLKPISIETPQTYRYWSG